MVNYNTDSDDDNNDIEYSTTASVDTKEEPESNGAEREDDNGMDDIDESIDVDEDDDSDYVNMEDKNQMKNRPGMMAKIKGYIIQIKRGKRNVSLRKT